MKNLGDSFAQFKGRLCGEKWAATHINPFKSYMAIVFIVALKPYTFVSRNVAFFYFFVCKILRTSRQSEIVPSIIRSITIDVVNIPEWPLSGHIQPRQPMRIPMDTIDTNYAISRVFSLSCCSRYATNTSFFWMLFPAKIPINGIIIQNFAQMILCDFVFFARHGKGRPSGANRLAIKSLLSCQTLGRLAPCTTNLG